MADGCCGVDTVSGVEPGGTTPGTILQASAVEENILGNLSTNPPTAVASCTGGVNLQSETVAAHGLLANTDHAGILSGQNNIVGADFSVVCGGTDNDITLSSANSFIGGGDTNRITSCDSGVIAGGDSNKIAPVSGSTNHATIGGGSLNDIFTAEHGTIAGGEDNVLGVTGTTANAAHSCITGGEDNRINRGVHSSILGGDSNDIGITTDSSFAVILGGAFNDVDGADFGCAGGRQAQVTDAGAWVWSDSAAQDEASQGIDSFFIKAGGGLWFRETDGFKGEELVLHQAHLTTTDAANTDVTLGALATDQHIAWIRVVISAVRDAGVNSLCIVRDVALVRSGGALTVVGGASVLSGSQSDGTGATLASTVTVSGSNIIARVNGNALENWQWPISWWFHEGGFTS